MKIRENLKIAAVAVAFLWWDYLWFDGLFNVSGCISSRMGGLGYFRWHPDIIWRGAAGIADSYAGNQLVRSSFRLYFRCSGCMVDEKGKMLIACPFACNYLPATCIRAYLRMR